MDDLVINKIGKYLPSLRYYQVIYKRKNKPFSSYNYDIRIFYFSCLAKLNSHIKLAMSKFGTNEIFTEYDDTTRDIIQYVYHNQNSPSLELTIFIRRHSCHDNNNFTYDFD